jgi:hypothetical protein
MSGDEVNGFNRRGSKAPTTDPFLAHNFQDLESFQKAQLLNKVTTWTSKGAVGAFRQFLCQTARVLAAHNSRQKAVSAPVERTPGSLTCEALYDFWLLNFDLQRSLKVCGRASVNDVAPLGFTRLSHETIYTLWFKCQMFIMEMMAYVTDNISKLLLIFLHLKNINSA